MVSSSLYPSVAQLVEQQTFNLWVSGSIPDGGTKSSGRSALISRLSLEALDASLSSYIRESGKRPISGSLTQLARVPGS